MCRFIEVACIWHCSAPIVIACHPNFTGWDALRAITLAEDNGFVMPEQRRNFADLMPKPAD